MKLYKAHITRFNKNFTWLFILNNLGYLFSFITLPLLISKFEYSTLGFVFTAQAIVFAISAIANYSFVFYVPSVSSEISSNKKFLYGLWNLAVNSRVLFSILLGFISILIVVNWFNNYLILWFFSLTLLLPKIINPALFCNALEKNSIILKIGFFSKLIFLICIYFLKNSNHINFFLGFSEFFVILFFLWKMDSNFFQLKILKFKTLFSFYRKTFNLFVVNLFSMLKPAIVLPAITYFLYAEYSAIYTLADKTINVIRSVSGSIFVSFFPIYNKEKFEINFLSKKSVLIVLLFSSLIIVMVWYLSPIIIYVLNNFEFNDLAIKTFRILSFSIPMFFIIIPLFSFLLNHNKWNAILLFSGIQLLSFIVLLFYFHETIFQVAIGFVVSEYILLVGYYFYVLFLERKHKVISS